MKAKRIILLRALAAALCGWVFAGFPAGGTQTLPLQDLSREELLISGRAAWEDGLFAAAVQYFERAAALSEEENDRDEAAVELARALRAQGEHEEALAILRSRDVVARHAPRLADYIHELAEIKLAQGDLQGALDTLDIPVADMPEPLHRFRARRRPRILVELGRMDEAMEAFAAYQEAYAESPEAAINLLEWAAALIQNQQQEEAVARLEQLIRVHGDSDEVWTAHLWLASILADQGSVEEAEARLATVLETDAAPAVKRGKAHFLLAELYARQDRFDDALAQLDRMDALLADGQALWPQRLFRGKILLQAGREEEGLPLLREVIRANPQEPDAQEAQLDVADFMLAEGRAEDAIREFQYYLDAFTEPEGRAHALLGRGWALFHLGRHAEAAATFEQAAEDSSDPQVQQEALVKMADALFSEGRYQRALDAYRSFLDTFPDHELGPQLLFQVALCQNHLAQPLAAQQTLMEIGQRFPGSDFATRADLQIADLQEEQGHWATALQTYDRMLESPEDATLRPQVLHRRGMVFYRLSRFDRAMQDFDTLLEEFPDELLAEHAYFMRGWCHFLMDDQEQALAVCRSFLEKFPDSQWAEEVRFWLGEYHFNRGNHEEAEAYFTTLADLRPQHRLADAALFWAARAASRQNDFLRAVDLLTRLIRAYPQSPRIAEARFAQGDALSQLGQFAAAILAFEEIIKSHPDSYLVDHAWGRKGDCHFTLGNDDPRRYEEAQACYEHVARSPTASTSIRLQALYKTGKCREKLERMDEALEHYMDVVYRHLQERRQGGTGDTLWFTRAAFNAAQIAESRDQWREALNIYQRVLDAGVPSSTEAQKRIQRIRLEHWLLF